MVICSGSNVFLFLTSSFSFSVSVLCRRHDAAVRRQRFLLLPGLEGRWGERRHLHGAHLETVSQSAAPGVKRGVHVQPSPWILIWSDLIWAAPRSRNLFQLILFVQTFNYSDFTAKTKVQTLEWHQMYCLCFLHLLLLLTWAGESRRSESGLTWRIRRIRRDWSGSAGLLYRLLVFGLEFHLKWGINKRKPHFNLIKTRFYFLFLCKLDIKVVRFRPFSCQSKAVNICK